MRILDRAGTHRRRLGDVLRRRRARRAGRRPDARPARPRNVDDLPEPARRANPIRKVGRQIEDVLRSTRRRTPPTLTDKAIEILDQVRIARPRERYHAYPFELSGGMCQRVVIALALACQPQLLIADEPTTGLDVTTQKTVMDLVVELTRERGMSTILITHDLGLAAAYCDRVVVMEKGQRGRDRAVGDDLQGARASLYAQADARDAAAGRDAARAVAGRDRGAAAPSAHGCRRRGRGRATDAAAGRSRSWSRNIRARASTTSLAQAVPRQAAAGAGNLPRGRRHQLHDRSRRERRPGRRIRLRQVDHLDDGDAADRQDRRH